MWFAHQSDTKVQNLAKVGEETTGTEDQTKEGERRKHEEVDEEAGQGVCNRKTQAVDKESKTLLCICTSFSSAVFLCSDPTNSNQRRYHVRSWTRGAPAARAAAGPANY